jgi:subtilisin family serine protease
MRTTIVLLCMSSIVTGSVLADPENLEGGVLIAHFPADMTFSFDPPTGGWCQFYWDSLRIEDCEDQVNRIDTGNQVIWFVLAAWDEDKEWCGTEFGFGEYDADAFVITDFGPCWPEGGLEIPTASWPGPGEGTAIVTTGAPWEGNFVPVYRFTGLAYDEGLIPLAADPATGFAGTSNCASPPDAWAADSLGGMGLFQDGVYACPEGLLAGGQGSGPQGGGGIEPEQGGGENPLPAGSYAENVVIIRFAPSTISFPQDHPEGPSYFRAPLSDAQIDLPGLRDGLAEIGVESFETIAPNWRHLDPSRTRDLHGNAVRLVDFTDVYRVALSGPASVDEVVSRLWGRPGIVYVEPDPRIQIYFPNDPYYPDQWHLNNPGEEECLEDVDMNAPEAWELSGYSGAGTKVGIIDGKVNNIHEDVSPFLDWALSRSFPDSLPWWNGGWGSHATSCAALAAAGTDNQLGIATLCNLPPSHDDSTMVILRIFPDGFWVPDTMFSRGADALGYVCGPEVNGRIGVVNCSWGAGYHMHCYATPRVAREAFRNAFLQGVNLVCAAGNEVGSVTGPCVEPDTAFAYPAAFTDYCLAVAAVNCQWARNPIHHVGSYIDLAGPGSGLWLPANGSTGYQYYTHWATSYASPVIAGSIAMLLGADPELTNEDCYSLLKLSAERPESLSAIQVGAGLPRMDRALSWIVPPCGVVHDSTDVYSSELVGEWPVWFMNVEGVNTAPETWEEFEVEVYRLEAQVQLPLNQYVPQVWPRGSRSPGWRLIDESLDGNPEPHYDALYYANWAGLVECGSNQCTFESYTYKVLGEPDRWVPFEIGDDFWLHYSYSVCDSVPSDVTNLSPGHRFGLRVKGSPAFRSGSMRLQLTMPSNGKVWVDVYGADGRLVRRLLEGTRLEAGLTEVSCDLTGAGAERVASGVYFVRSRAKLDGTARVVSNTRTVVIR